MIHSFRVKVCDTPHLASRLLPKRYARPERSRMRNKGYEIAASHDASE
jgi:hypothetical protein